MPSRYSDLIETTEGFRRSGVPLVAYGTDGFQPAGFSDDLGLYYFVPAISRRLHLSLPGSVSFFYGVLLTLCFVFGAISLALLFTPVTARLFAVAALGLLFAVVFHVGDIYLFEAAVPVLLIPSFLLVARRAKAPLMFVAFMATAGVIVATAGLIRSSAALPTALFLVLGTIWYLGGTVSWKMVLVASLAIGMVVPVGLFSRVKSQRDSFLLSQTAIVPVDLERHAVWHLAYQGLGYLKLPSMPAVCDEASKAKVYSINPSAAYLSADYDHVLRVEVFRLFTQHPATVLLTLLGKAAVTLGKGLLFANIGLIAAWFYRKERMLDRIFACSFVVAAVPVILVVPAWQYVMGVISIATVYGAMSLAHALEVRAASRAITQSNAKSQVVSTGGISRRPDNAFSA